MGRSRMPCHCPRRITAAPSGLTRRRALASLELVLVLPLLVFLAAMIYTIGRVGLNKVGANVQARRDAWARPVTSGQAEAAPLPAPLFGHTLIAERNGGLNGLASGAVDRAVSVAPVAPTNVRVQARLFVLIDPLDHHSAPFRPHNRFTPDRRAARLVAAPFHLLDGAGGRLAGMADEAKSKGLTDPRDQVKALLDRRRDIGQEITKVATDPDLSKDEKARKTKELLEEREGIDKALKEMRDGGATLDRLRDVP